MANHGIPLNSGRNRSDDEGEIAHSLHSEKRAKTDGNDGLHQESGPTPNDTQNGTVTPTAPIPNDESVGPVFRYSRDLGTAGSIARRNEEEYQALNDVDMQVAEAGSADSGDESEQSEVPEETNFTRIAGAKDRALTVRIKLAALKGDTWQEKRKDLLALLVEIGIGTTTTVKQKKQAEGDYFEFAAQSEQEVAVLLQVEFDTPDGFFKPDPNEGESAIARTIEVYGLAPRTTKETIRLSLAKFGAVTSTTFRPCTRGIKTTAEVVFQSANAIEKLQTSKNQAVFIGTDMARLKSIAGEQVTWTMGHVLKLSGMRFGTTPLDLIDVLEQGKANFIDIPRIYNRDGSKMRRLQEAFVYFNSKEDMESATKIKFQLGNNPLEWCDLNTKKCYQCGSMEHTKRGCEEHKKNMDTKNRMRMVMNFNRGGSLNVVSRTTFANMAGKSYASMAKTQTPTPQTQQTLPTQQERQQQQQQQHQQQQQQERNDAQAREIEQLRAMEKARNEEIKDLKNDLREANNFYKMLTDQMSCMMQMMNMLCSAMGDKNLISNGLRAQIEGAIAGFQSNPHNSQIRISQPIPNPPHTSAVTQTHVEQHQPGPHE